MREPIGMFENLLEHYMRYYETPFSVRDEMIAAERGELLRAEGEIHREPWLEVLPRFRSCGRTIAESCQRVGAPEELAQLAVPGLLPADAELYLHQEQALTAAREGKDVVLTAATGAGKTEAFLLPLLASLLDESAGWVANGSPSPDWDWWSQTDAPYIAQREAERGRRAGIRALLLYPMNALVEDQLLRLRHVLDSDRARAWLDENRDGHRFYFGRYTGPTPQPGNRDSRRETKLRSLLRQSAERAAQVAGDEQKRYFLPQLDGAEMRSRWDMQDHPPDLLITNYSMLNIMLMRGVEDGIFAQTRAWLEEDDAHRFTIVADELHSYRGTSGTEIAFLLRNLLLRLGLQDKPEKVRILAASASAGGDEQGFLDFLSQFFGRERDGFELISGEPVQPSGDTSALREVSRSFARLGSEVAGGASPAELTAVVQEATEAVGADGDDAVALATHLGVDGCLLEACGQPGGRARARSAATVAGNLFDGDEEERLAALRGLLWLMGETHEHRPDRQTVRAHYFFRSVQGVWACSNPRCPEVEAAGFASPRRRVGKLYLQPQIRCGCGSRVLDLLYCQTCGESFLGGYRSQDPDEVRGWYLVPDVPDLDQLPEAPTTERTAGRYALFWPRPEEEPKDPDWHREGYDFGFERCRYDSLAGRVAIDPLDPAGWLFHVKGGTGDGSNREPPGLPVKCPHCDDSWETGRQYRAVEDPGRSRSPIRFMRTGFEKVGQVLADALLRELETPSRKLVSFADSRQDAAKMAAGLEKRHYQDTVRQLLAEAALTPTSDAEDLEAFEAFATDRDRSAETRERYLRFLSAYPGGAEGLRAVLLGYASAEDETAATQLHATVSRRLKSVSGIRDELERKLLDLGLNPGSPDFSMRRYKAASGWRMWTGLYDWNRTPPQPREAGELDEDDRSHHERIRASLLNEAEYILFAKGRRDFESIGLGWVCSRPDETTPGPLAPELMKRAVDSSIRILGDRQRFMDRRNRYGSDTPPAPMRKFLEQVAARNGADPAELVEAVARELESSDAASQFLLLADGLYLSPASRETWVCRVCRYRHLHPSGGVCTDCLADLPAEPVLLDPDEDYYAHLATQAGDPFRLHTEELTGQTDRGETQARQARFQGVFLGQREQPLVDEIDLLSVTTTMEVGVDIGSLRTVLLANMPPLRFNYQQRVGRAGRRGEPVAVALTIARGRSHDDYYFQHPDQITGDLPPTPYVDMKRMEILRRCLLAEVLRRAFLEVPSTAGFAPGDNVHGQFGTADGWQDASEEVLRWIAANRDQVEEILDALLIGTTPELQAQREDLLHFVAEEAASEIDAAARQTRSPATDLSQRLAEAGLLPMFGFPTRMRELFHGRPERARPWPPPFVIDRDAGLAISEFAPGSDRVKDKAIHRCIGVASFQPRGNHVWSDPDPLGFTYEIGQCSRCQALDTGTDSTGQCPVCLAPEREDGEPGYRRFQIAQPKGYRTEFRPRDYNEWFEWAPRASRARMSTETGAMQLAHHGPALLERGVTSIFEINDNAGRDFLFEPAADGDGWICPELDDGSGNFALPASEAARGRRVALAAVKSTDVLVIGVDPASLPAGITLRPSTPARRGAWYSLGFLIRDSAARLLDVETPEIEVGLRSVQLPDGDWTAQVFLSDSLANGAGYCSHLGKEEVFGDLLARASARVSELEAHTNSGEPCDSACYKCLKDYQNMAYHGLLDWRLAADMLTLLRGEGFSPERLWEDLGLAMTRDFARQFDQFEFSQMGNVPAALHPSRCLAAFHPLEDLRFDRPEGPVARAVAAALEAGYGGEGERQLRLVDYFDLLRRPGEVYSRLWQ